MIPLPAGVRVWLATGHTDMRKGFPSLALQVQEILHRDPLGGHLFCFRGRRGNLLKVIWHDGQGACLFTKRLERGRFLWPSPADGVVTKGDPDGAREVLVPELREDHAAAGAVPRDATRFCRTQTVGHDLVREVWPAPALEPAKRTLSARRHRAWRLDAGRPSRRLHDGPASAS